MTDESSLLWHQVIQPLLTVLRLHTTVEQIDRLRRELMADTSVPEEAVAIVTELRNLRTHLEHLDYLELE